MAVTFKPIFTQIPNDAVVAFVNATGTATQALITAGVNGTRVDKIGVVSTDTASHVMQFYINDGADKLIGSISVSAGAGNDGTTAAMNGLNTTLLPYIVDGVLTLKAGWILKAAVTVAVTAAKTVNVIVTGGDF